MPNYRYNMQEYERRNNYGSRSQNAGQRPCQQGCAAARSSQEASKSSYEAARNSREAVRNSCEMNRNSRETARNSCEMNRNSRETARNSCEVPCRDRRNEGEMSCAVDDKYDALSGMPLAMAYVPWQMWRKIYDAEKGFCQGTIFEELDKPFRGMGGVC